MKIIYTNSNHNIDCEVFNKEIEYGTCAQCQNNMLGDFILNKTCSVCLAINENKPCIIYYTEHGIAPNNKFVKKGYVLKSSDLPTLSEEGYIFLGWDKHVGYIINENTIITASWQKIPTPPTGYFETLKYIETSGDNTTEDENGQYIDIPYHANSKMIYYLTAQIIAGPIGTSIADTAKTVFAKDFGKTRGGSGGSAGAGSNNIFFLYDENGWGNPTKVSNGGDNIPHTYIINYYNVDVNGKGYIKVDNGEIQRFARQVTQFVDKYTPFSLGSWAEWGAEGVGKQVKHMWCAKSKIYRLYIKNGETNESVINLVPVIVVKEYTDKNGITHPIGTVGVYDESSNEFYKNVGKGTLGYEKLDGTYVPPYI